jgi:hypothetical protein
VERHSFYCIQRVDYRKWVNQMDFNISVKIDKVNQIDRNVCCLDTKDDGMGMINIENLIRSKQIKIIYKIIHSDLECWNYIQNSF